MLVQSEFCGALFHLMRPSVCVPFDPDGDDGAGWCGVVPWFSARTRRNSD